MHRDAGTGELGCDAKFADAIARKEKTIIPGDEIEVDFAASTIRYAGEQFTFPALGRVPQSLVIAGGVENLVSREARDLRRQRVGRQSNPAESSTHSGRRQARAKGSYSEER